MIKLGRFPSFLTVARATIALHCLMKSGLWWGVTTGAIGLCRLSQQGVREVRLRTNGQDPALMFGMAGKAILCCQALVKGQAIGRSLAFGGANFFDRMARDTSPRDGALEGGMAGGALIIQLRVRLGQLARTNHRIRLKIDQGQDA